MTSEKKERLCKKLIEGGYVKAYDFIRYSYTKDRDKNLNRKESKNNIAPTIPSRGDTLGVVVYG